MSIRAEYKLRQWVRLAASSVGTPRVSFALLVLAAVYLAAASVWARVAPGVGAHALATSYAYTCRPPPASVEPPITYTWPPSAAPTPARTASGNGASVVHSSARGS